MSAIACVDAVSWPVVFAIDAMPGVLPWLRLYCATMKKFKICNTNSLHQQSRCLPHFDF
jgi:hypothetical protein